MVRYRISQLAERVGVPSTTLRYYESRGLLPARRTPGSYRSYDERDVERVRFIVTAKDLGLPLDRIRDLLGVWRDGMCRDVRSRLLPLVTGQIDAADDRVRDLRAFRGRLVAARDRLRALPDRDAPCDPDCAFLTGGGPAADAPPPVACALDPADHAARLDRWRTVLSGTAPRRLGDGSVRTEIDHDRTAGIAALIADEVRCCPFLTFTLTVTHDGARLDASAPPDARHLLDDLFTAPTGVLPC
ncbi:hypothetical protein AD006_03185 [Pseudonocardia sp. EC080610-09]|uniref:MerR family transcriptional regulator n=1 Tax=unclassified Pseudonocardia TaxID=2619320 RepID=UPI000705EF1A|nr:MULTISPECIES: MerR family transcriptional regulator [unclassified Pseudonocardia]ALL74568.1 hypothetical protein AD006_03185 [Pseudonocardia sp. EC080610-09]ALL81588.1 hypothetical protein AD017_11000 [Pseudonocardia sp. EC080619-01]